MIANEKSDVYEHEFVLCQGNDPCCPTLSVSANHVDIRDDDGGSVRLTKDQFRILVEHSPKVLGDSV